LAGGRRVAGATLRRAGWVTRTDLERFQSSTADLTRRIDWLGMRADALEEREEWHVAALENLRNAIAIEAVTRWIRHASLATHPLVSVVTPTKDRPRQLERALRSVVSHCYRNWELLVDDGGANDSRSVAEAIGDRRIRWSRSPSPGESAGRNHALEAATGELIAYLDDDNVMDPEWLYAVAWAFEQRPDVDVLYGAHIVDDYLRASGESSGAMPSTHLNQWSRERLRQCNLTDMSAIAHRARLPEARFDEAVKVAPDWDLLLRLTADNDPLMLPVIACYYTSDAPNRISAGSTFRQHLEQMAARARAS
jgi:glycosyltransferase involved in cell wall biosynthesis